MKKQYKVLAIASIFVGIVLLSILFFVTKSTKESITSNIISSHIIYTNNPSFTYTKTPPTYTTSIIPSKITEAPTKSTTIPYTSYTSRPTHSVVPTTAIVKPTSEVDDHNIILTINNYSPSQIGVYNQNKYALYDAILEINTINEDNIENYAIYNIGDMGIGYSQKFINKSESINGTTPYKNGNFIHAKITFKDSYGNKHVWST